MRGLRNQERNYCSRICCSASIKNALKLKEINPGMEIYILYRDMMTYGFSEDYTGRPRERGAVHPLRAAGPAAGGIRPGGRQAGFENHRERPHPGPDGCHRCGCARAGRRRRPLRRNQGGRRLFKVSLSPDGFFKEAHVKLRPVEFSADGVFLCGLAHYPSTSPRRSSRPTGGGPGLDAALPRHVVASGAVCEVDEKKCMGCGECIAACTYGAIEFRETRRAKRPPSTRCSARGRPLQRQVPDRAIVLKHFTDEELLSQIDARRG